ncbi:MAG TPA: RNA polymerase sigma factor [Solirubrobacteraceae bacterium]|nr:RNA polymerase sigma factor [Solirubrobacteraceae bacterium]
MSVAVIRHRTHIRTSGAVPDRRAQDDFERLYAAEAPGLFSFLAYRTGDRALAQDLLADAFERALRARGRFDRRKGSERTWLYAIALNVLRDHARRDAAHARASERLVPVPEGGLDSRLEAVEDRDELARALAKLSDEEREAIALRFGAELTVPEIAETLGEKLTTVEGRVYRALRKLRAELDD